MALKVRIFGDQYDTGISWTGSVWQREDNGQQSAYKKQIVRDWIEDLIVMGGDDPADFEAEVADALGTITDD